MIRGALAGALLCIGLVGCGSKRIPECDAFVKTIEKIAACPKVPDTQRDTILKSAKTIRDSLEMLDQAGGVKDAPADLVSSLRDACKTQDASLTTAYADCLK